MLDLTANFYPCADEEILVPSKEILILSQSFLQPLGRSIFVGEL